MIVEIDNAQSYCITSERTMGSCSDSPIKKRYHYYISDVNTAQMREMLDVNVMGLTLFTREIIKDMRQRGVDDGHIFHINRYRT